MPSTPPGTSRPGKAIGTPTLSAMNTTSAGRPRKNSMKPVAIQR